MIKPAPTVQTPTNRLYSTGDAAGYPTCEVPVGLADGQLPGVPTSAQASFNYWTRSAGQHSEWLRRIPIVTWQYVCTIPEAEQISPTVLARAIDSVYGAGSVLIDSAISGGNAGAVCVPDCLLLEPSSGTGEGDLMGNSSYRFALDDEFWYTLDWAGGPEGNVLIGIEQGENPYLYATYANPATSQVIEEARLACSLGDLATVEGTVYDRAYYIPYLGRIYWHSGTSWIGATNASGSAFSLRAEDLLSSEVAKVAWSSLYVGMAGQDSGEIRFLTSTDAVTWTEQASITTEATVEALTWSETLETWLLFDSDGIVYRKDAEVWTALCSAIVPPAPEVFAMKGTCFIGDTVVFLAKTWNRTVGTHAIWLSEDYGTTWEQQMVGSSDNLTTYQRLVYGGRYLWLFGERRIYRSASPVGALTCL